MTEIETIPADTTGGDSLARLDLPTAYEPVAMALAAIIDQVGPNCSLEQFDRANAMVESLNKLAKTAVAVWKFNARAKILADGDVTIGTVRFYVGVKKDTTCDNAELFLLAMMEMFGVDDEQIRRRVVAAIAPLLCANPFKPGETRKTIGEEEFARYFSVKEEGELREGKPKKEASLQKFDNRFDKTATKGGTPQRAEITSALEENPF